MSDLDSLSLRCGRKRCCGRGLGGENSSPTHEMKHHNSSTHHSAARAATNPERRPHDQESCTGERVKTIRHFFRSDRTPLGPCGRRWRNQSVGPRIATSWAVARPRLSSGHGLDTYVTTGTPWRRHSVWDTLPLLRGCEADLLGGSGASLDASSEAALCGKGGHMVD